MDDARMLLTDEAWGRIAAVLVEVKHPAGAPPALSDHKVTVAPRKGFDPAAARDTDVVLLDWSQSEDSVEKANSPFGKLEDWSKPTVLLGSAGLFMAGQWQLIGGAG